MSIAGILFIAAGLTCLLGLISSLANPAWFRFNGQVPARWKIARLWLLLIAICAIFALVHRGPAVPNSAPITETTTMPDGASVFQIDPGPSVDAAADDVVRDAVRAADEGVQDAARATDDAMPIDLPTPPPPPAPPPSKRIQR